jgi:hypothetical protein
MPPPKIWFKKMMSPFELKMFVLTSLMTLAVETAFPVTIELLPSPPVTLFVPVSDVEVAALPKMPSLVDDAVIVEEFVFPVESGLTVFELSPFSTVVDAAASPVAIVPPVVVAVPPVPSFATAGGLTLIFTFVLSEPPVDPIAVTENE